MVFVQNVPLNNNTDLLLNLIRLTIENAIIGKSIQFSPRSNHHVCMTSNSILKNINVSNLCKTIFSENYLRLSFVIKLRA